MFFVCCVLFVVCCVLCSGRGSLIILCWLWFYIAWLSLVVEYRVSVFVVFVVVDWRLCVACCCLIVA